MKRFNKYTKLIPSLLMFAAITMANPSSQHPADYQIIALNDCQVISEKAMTQRQLDTYLARLVVDTEKLMEELQTPAHDMEAQLLSF